MKLEVILGASSEASFDITLNDNPFVYKWLNELRWCLSNCDIEQQEAFASFLTLDEAVDRLINACKIVNRYLKGFIDIRGDVVNQPQEYFNYLHEQFEKLSGEFGKPTRLFAIANDELKKAIRDLNFYIHRTETKIKTGRSFYFSFNKDQYRRASMTLDDYQYTQFNVPAGSLFVHYAELGKDFYSLFRDGLTIEYAGHKNSHYYTGEASIALEDRSTLSDKRYTTWLQSQGVNPYNKLLGHGTAVLGTVDNLPDALEKLKTYKFLKNILIKD